MADIFDEVHAEAQGDVFDQLHAQAASAQPPAQQGDPVLRDLGEMAADTAKGLYQVSAPGIAASLLQKRYPGLVSQLPAALQPTPLSDLGNQVAVTALPMFAGAAELPRTSTPPVPKPVAAAGESAAGGMALRVARHLPYVGKVIRAGELASDVADMIKGKPATPPAAPAPEVPPWWGKSNVGPPEQWGATHSRTSSRASSTSTRADNWPILATARFHCSAYIVRRRCLERSIDRVRQQDFASSRPLTGD